MNKANIPEIPYLLSLVEKRYGKSILTSNHFEALSIVIEHEIGETLSCSTLKRMWGYMSMKPIPRMASLDILARYVGYKDFKAFCTELKNAGGSQSQFVETTVIFPQDLQVGTKLKIGWQPNRLILIEYKGNSKFVVLDSYNSKLCVGDIFESGPFILGYPMYASNILRGEQKLPPFVAGRDTGINLLIATYPSKT